MTAVTSPTVARKKAREHAAKLLEADDAERRRLEGERRKRVAEHAGEIAGNDAEIAQLKAQIEQLRTASARRLAAIVGDGVSAEQAAAMTGREVREVRAAVKARAADDQAPPKKKPTAPRAALTQPAAA